MKSPENRGMISIPDGSNISRMSDKEIREAVENAAKESGITGLDAVTIKTSSDDASVKPFTSWTRSC